MAGTVLYRKWRPTRFADIVGQDPIVRTLRNAIVQDKIAHAYLFSGPRGTGKTSTGRILAKAINVPHGDDGEPIGDSDEARSFDEGRALDLVEIDAASNRGIDNIRDLRDRANYVPNASRFKVYLIDEVHQLTDAAADALLKTLEEPPPHVVFILATTDPESLKATVLSRCQRFDFRRVSVADISARLRVIAEAEGVAIPDEALTLIAREATGSLRDAINLLDQVWAAYGDAVSLENTVAALGLSVDKRALQLARAALTKNLQEGLGLIAAVQEDAVDLARFTRQVVEHLRHALLQQSGAVEGLALSEPEREALTGLVKDVEPEATVAALRGFASADMRSDPFASLPLELALAQLVYAPAPPVAAAPATEARNGDGRRSGSGQRGRSGAPGSRRPSGPRRPPPARRESAPVAAPANATQGSDSAPVQSKPAKPRRELTPEEQLLEQIQAELKSQGERKLAAYLKGSCTVTLDGDEATFTFYSTYVNIHKSKVEEQLDALATAISKVRDRPTTVRCSEAEKASDAKSPLIAEAERLGAKVVGRRES